jgi:hypothetical protein
VQMCNLLISKLQLRFDYIEHVGISFVEGHFCIESRDSFKTVALVGGLIYLSTRMQPATTDRGKRGRGRGRVKVR